MKYSTISTTGYNLPNGIFENGDLNPMVKKLTSNRSESKQHN